MATFPGVAQRHRAVRESLDIEQRHINKTTIYSRLHIYVAGPSCYVSFGGNTGYCLYRGHQTTISLLYSTLNRIFVDIIDTLNVHSA